MRRQALLSGAAGAGEGRGRLAAKGACGGRREVLTCTYFPPPPSENTWMTSTPWLRHSGMRSAYAVCSAGGRCACVCVCVRACVCVGGGTP